MSPGAKGGFIGGLAYGITLAVYILFVTLVLISPKKLLLLIEEATERISPELLKNIDPLLSEAVVLMLMVIAGLIVILIASAIGTLIGLLYEKIHIRIWRFNVVYDILLALAVGLIYSLFHGFTLNLPISRSLTLMVSIILTPLYSIPLYIIYSREAIKPIDELVEKLDTPHKSLMILLLKKSRLTFWDLKTTLSTSEETLLRTLRHLEDLDVINLRYDNKYELTTKGKLIAKYFLVRS